MCFLPKKSLGLNVTNLKRDFIRNAVHCSTHSEVKSLNFSRITGIRGCFLQLVFWLCHVIKSKPAYFVCNIRIYICLKSSSDICNIHVTYICLKSNLQTGHSNTGKYSYYKRNTSNFSLILPERNVVSFIYFQVPVDPNVPKMGT